MRVMIYYRMMRNNEPDTVNPSLNDKDEIVDLIYSNCMPSRRLYAGKRMVWSLSKTPEAALRWKGSRGKGMYDRLAVYEFDGTEGDFFDLTSPQTWISLIHQSKNRGIVKNLNGAGICEVDAIRCLIPCQRSAMSMAIASDEVAFIPRKKITFETIKDGSNIPTNPQNAESVLTDLSYNDETIELLLEQLEQYDISRKPVVRDMLLKLKSAM